MAETAVAIVVVVLVQVAATDEGVEQQSHAVRVASGLTSHFLRRLGLARQHVEHVEVDAGHHRATEQHGAHHVEERQGKAPAAQDDPLPHPFGDQPHPHGVLLSIRSGKSKSGVYSLAGWFYSGWVQQVAPEPFRQ